MKKVFICLVAIIAATSCYAQKMSVLGDSYSTFGGEMTPATNLCWYNGPDGAYASDTIDVKSADQTWWRILSAETGMSVDTNNSYSGSTICLTGYNGADFSDRAFITRIHNLGNPDVIYVFGGTNDSWAGAPIGEYMYADWTEADLYSFRPAFAYLLDSLKRLYPHARIVNITNCDLSPEITSSMDTICRKYGVKNVQLRGIDKIYGHPSAAGMQAIADQLLHTGN